MNLISVRRYAILFTVIASIIVLSIYFFVSRSTQAGKVLPPESSADGYRTTPAGKLVADASTGLPAIAPLTMNFVRSPDVDGPDGTRFRTRYVIHCSAPCGRGPCQRISLRALRTFQTRIGVTSSMMTMADADPTPQSLARNSLSNM